VVGVESGHPIREKTASGLFIAENDDDTSLVSECFEGAKPRSAVSMK
jgi:hypothetical protein